MFWKTRKSERDGEETAAAIAQITEDLGDPVLLYRFLLVCLAGNSIIWLAVLLFPNLVYRFIGPIANDRIGMIILGVPLGLGLFAAYCLLRIIFPDVEDNKNLASEMMASFTYQADSTRRWYIWLFSIVAGLANVALLILADLYLSGQF